MITKATLVSKLDKRTNKMVYFIEMEGTRTDAMGQWFSSGTMFKLIRCMGYWVGMAKVTTPTFVFKNMDEVADYIEANYCVVLEGVSK